jgi:hypothetical protein
LDVCCFAQIFLARGDASAALSFMKELAFTKEPGFIALSSFDDMRIEVAAHRLSIRAILTYLACSHKNSAVEMLSELGSMLEGTGPYAMIAEDLDDELRQAAMERARNRLAHFMANIDKLPIAPA